MSEQKPLLVLVDGSSYLFRAYHALPPLTNSKGEATGALVGVINMLRKLIADYQPSNIGVVFDAPGKTFRNDLYAEYKANRPPMPDDLREQIKPLHEIIRAMGLPVIIESGVEADDVIGTLAAEATRDGVETVISTSDKDLAQLVSDHVTLVNTMSETKSDRQGVIDKFGVAPEQIIDYLALVGDISDNIPGVPKCGPKTAAKWLSEFGDIDNLLANADSIKGKIGESLRASMEQIPLSRELTTIKTDVKLHESIPDLVATPADTQKLREWYRHIESNRLLATLDEEAGVADAETPEAEAPAELKYETILTQDDFERWLEKLSSAELICIDTETTSLDYMQAEIVGLSFSVEAG
ncbi:DNA polymerase I, partial [Solemya velum gill symbiont]